MNRRSSKGYTMVEMLVVLAIIAIMMLIIIPRLAFPRKGAGLKGAASEIMSAMNTARRLAITERTPYAVIFNLDTIPPQYFIAKYDSRFDPWVPSAITFPGPPTGPSTFSWEGGRPQTEEKADLTDVYRDVNNVGQVDYPLDSGGSTGDYYLYTNWQIVGDLHTLPDNIAITDIKRWNNTEFGSDETNFNVRRTEDEDLSGALDGDASSCDSSFFKEDTGIDGIDCTTDAYGIRAPDPGEHDDQITSVYRFVVFEPTGTSDKAIIHLWDITDGRREVITKPDPVNPLVLPSSLKQLGYPPNLNPKFVTTPPPVQIQSDYFKIGSPTSPDDAKYYTVVVNPITGAATVYDYAWGEEGRAAGTNGPDDPGDWDRKKDG